MKVPFRLSDLREITREEYVERMEKHYAELHKRLSEDKSAFLRTLEKRQELSDFVDTPIDTIMDSIEETKAFARFLMHGAEIMKILDSLYPRGAYRYFVIKQTEQVTVLSARDYERLAESERIPIDYI